MNFKINFKILYVFFWVFPRRHTLHPALEDGTDGGFRNVGKLQSDAGEIPKRIHTIFKTRQKSEIKNKTEIVSFRVCVNWERTSTQFKQWSLWSSLRNISIPWQHSDKTSMLLYIALKAFFARGKRDIRHTMHPISTKHSVSHKRNDSWWLKTAKNEVLSGTQAAQMFRQKE